MGKPAEFMHKLHRLAFEDTPPPHTANEAFQQAGPVMNPIQMENAPQPWAQPPINRQFPMSFNLYRDLSWGKLRYHIGQHQDERLYCVSVHTGFSGKPNVVLHNGPSESDDLLAGINFHLGRSQTAILPPLSLVGAADEEEIKTSGLLSVTHSFFTEVKMPGGDMRREQFEWRRSHDAVQDFGGSWELVRITGGGEVVAICAINLRSLTSAFHFEFLGTGASGVLGERWAVMVIISALGMYERERSDTHRAAPGGGGFQVVLPGSSAAAAGYGVGTMAPGF
jgi:hypothetical protein